MASVKVQMFYTDLIWNIQQLLTNSIQGKQKNTQVNTGPTSPNDFSSNPTSHKEESSKQLSEIPNQPRHFKIFCIQTYYKKFKVNKDFLKFSSSKQNKKSEVNKDFFNYKLSSKEVPRSNLVSHARSFLPSTAQLWNYLLSQFQWRTCTHLSSLFTPPGVQLASIYEWIFSVIQSV